MSRLPLPEDKHADFVQTLELERAEAAEEEVEKAVDTIRDIAAAMEPGTVTFLTSTPPAKDGDDQ